MSARIATRRKNRFNVFREAEKLGSYDEFPILLPDIDPQVHVSRNDVDQPFDLLCEKDTVLALMSGRARVAFREGGVRYFDCAPGDFVYVPGGVAHRIVVSEPGVMMRYKARDPGREAVLWFCDACGEELDRLVWDAGSRLSQEAYQSACTRHNSDTARRTCTSCGAAHPELDLSPFRWSAVAEALSSAEEDA